jgi:hypothetical protein
MKRRSTLRRIGVALCLCGMLANLQRAQAQAPVEPAPAVDIIDVAVENGMLVGEVRTPEGRLLSGQHVRVNSSGNGTFRVGGIREGVHEVVCCNRSTCIRVWPKETAPPHSATCVCLVCDECAAPVARQVNPPRRLGPLANAFATYPIATTALIGAGIGAAIAIPIATGQKPASP